MALWYRVMTLAVMLCCLWSAAATAQTSQEAEGTEEAQEMAEAEASEYVDSNAGWKQQRFLVGGFYGGLTGGTSLGLVDNIFFRTQLNMGSDSVYGLRFGWAFAPRFDLELEYGRSSPGLIATLTDLQGQGKTEVDFADLDLDYLVAVVNYSMIERSRRVVPYLSLGVGTVSVSSSTESIADDRKPGLIFGAGLRVRVIDNLALRADLRGLRSGFGTKQQEGDLPGVFVGDFNASNVLWSVGLDLRF